MIVRLLGPLMELETAGDLTGLAKGIGYQVVEALGVLERSKVAQEMRSLDQEGRGALRRHGVRFGAYHIFLPALLKPAPRTLAAQLWALRNGGLDQRGLDEIAHLAGSGRTSIKVDREIAKGLYRAAGFRVSGERAVRVDILERLADLIRPAIAYRPGTTPGAPPDGTADGDAFVATVGMTSLVGCSGEDFASILKSLGYTLEARPGPAITVPLVPAAATAPAVVTPPSGAARRARRRRRATNQRARPAPTRRMPSLRPRTPPAMRLRLPTARTPLTVPSRPSRPNPARRPKVPPPPRLRRRPSPSRRLPKPSPCRRRLRPRLRRLPKHPRSIRRRCASVRRNGCRERVGSGRGCARRCRGRGPGGAGPDRGLAPAASPASGQSPAAEPSARGGSWARRWPAGSAPGSGSPGRRATRAAARRGRRAPRQRGRSAHRTRSGSPSGPFRGRPSGAPGRPAQRRAASCGAAARPASAPARAGSRPRFAVCQAGRAEGAARSRRRREALTRPHAGGSAAARQMAVVRALRADPIPGRASVRGRFRAGERNPGREPGQGHRDRGCRDGGRPARDPGGARARPSASDGGRPEARLLYEDLAGIPIAVDPPE